jgi:putative transposase
MVDGRRAKHLRKEMYTTLTRLDERDAADWRITERFESYRNVLTDLIEKASREIVEYAKRFDEPVIVMEDIDVGGESLRDAMFEHRRLNMWSFNTLVERISVKANADGIPVAFVSPEYTSQTCHQCNRIGEREGSFECLNDDCWVSTYQSDINAAAVIAKRYNPWGETCRLESDGDDSPRDGSSRDGTVEPRERGNSSNHTSRNRSRTSPEGHWLPDTDAGVSRT